MISFQVFKEEIITLHANYLNQDSLYHNPFTTNASRQTSQGCHLFLFGGMLQVTIIDFQEVTVCHRNKYYRGEIEGFV